MWPLLFVGYGYLLGAALIGCMMIAQELRVAIQTRRVPRAIGELGFLLNFIFAVGAIWAHAAVFASGFKDHGTPLNSVLILVGFTATVLGLAKILVNIGFFQARDGANPPAGRRDGNL